MSAFDWSAAEAGPDGDLARVPCILHVVAAWCHLRMLARRVLGLRLGLARVAAQPMRTARGFSEASAARNAQPFVADDGLPDIVVSKRCAEVRAVHTSAN